MVVAAPAVAYLKSSRNQVVWQDRVMASMTAQQRAEFITYSNKASGWLVIGAGAACAGPS